MQTWEQLIEVGTWFDTNWVPSVTNGTALCFVSPDPQEVGALVNGDYVLTAILLRHVTAHFEVSSTCTHSPIFQSTTS